MNWSLLNNLCEIISPSGNEGNMKAFLLEYIRNNKKKWKVTPEIINDASTQDCLGLVFGEPSVAIMAHMDTVGFMVRYQNQLLPVGSPDVDKNTIITGEDRLGPIDCGISIDKSIDNGYRIYYDFLRGIETGTLLAYKPDFHLSGNYILSPGLDNRVGIWNALQLAEDLKNGLILFTCMEEQGGGTVSFLTRMIYEEYKITRVLISDVTWASDGVIPGKGVVISLKDHYIPRRSFTDQVIHVARLNSINYQIEVEGTGSSDGGEIQRSPYPVDWCFIGPPVLNVHTKLEKVHTGDVLNMKKLYSCLMKEL